MAITTVNQKLAALALGNWTLPVLPVSSDGIQSDDKHVLLRLYPHGEPPEPAPPGEFRGRTARGQITLSYFLPVPGRHR